MIRQRILRFNWRLAVAHILVNAVALGLTFLILPNLSIAHPNKLLVMLVAGLIFGLLNAFIRPVLQFVMFNFLFATFGLVLIIINFILLLILDAVLPGWFEASRWWVWFVAALFVGLFGVIFDNLLGLSPPIVDRVPQNIPPTITQEIEQRLAGERQAESIATAEELDTK